MPTGSILILTRLLDAAEYGRYALVFVALQMAHTLIMLIILTPLREAGPFAGLLIGNLLVLCFDLPFMLKRMKGGTYQPDKTKSYLLYGLPICFSLLLEYALSTSDRFVIAAMLGEADVGRYSAGYGLANRSIDVLFIWIGLAVTPMLELLHPARVYAGRENENAADYDDRAHGFKSGPEHFTAAEVWPDGRGLRNGYKLWLWPCARLYCGAPLLPASGSD